MREMTAAEVQKMIEEGKQLNIIDVRETDEFAAGTVPGSVNIPLGLIQFKMNELDKKKEYILICRSGARSGMATRFLDSLGYQVVNMSGGMLDWNGKIEYPSSL